jgi:benzoate/toluate 1,2-dioxygenase beta subunit
MNVASPLELLIHREARLLDLQRWDDWLALFSQDCEYWVPATPGQTSAKTEVSLFYEDRALMETRVKRLLHPSAHSLATPIRTARVISGVMIESGGLDEAEAVVTSSFHLLEQHGTKQRMFGGVYTHHLRSNGGGWKIRAKRVDMINCDVPMEVIETFI